MCVGLWAIKSYSLPLSLLAQRLCHTSLMLVALIFCSISVSLVALASYTLTLCLVARTFGPACSL